MADELLPRPEIIGATETGRLGVREVSVDPEDLIWFTSPSKKPIEPGSSLSFFINDTEIPVNITEITPEVVRYDGIHVDAFENMLDGDFTVYYKWKYADGSEAVSARAQWNIKRTVPGNPREPIGARINTALAPLNYSPRLISPDSTMVAFTLGPWENASVGDVPELKINGKFIKLPPLGADALGGIVEHALDREALIKIGVGMVEGTWSVRDTNGNWSLYAPSVMIPLTIEDDSLPPAPNMFRPGSPTDEPDIFPQDEIIEIDKFGVVDGVIVSVAAPASWVSRLKDLLGVTLHWHGIDAAGTVWDFNDRKDVRSLVIPRFTIPFDRFVRLGNGGRLVLSCTLHTSQGDKTSNIAVWEIAGIVESTIEESMAPSIKQADGYSHTLKLIEARPTVTVVTGKDWQEGDIIELVVNGNNDAAFTQLVGASGAQPFEVPEDIYVPAEGEPITLQYTVRRGGGRMSSSTTSYIWEDKRMVPLGNMTFDGEGKPLEVEFSPDTSVKVSSDLLIGDKIGEMSTSHDGFKFPTVVRMSGTAYELVRNRRGPEPPSASVLFAVEDVPGLSLRLQRWAGVDPAEPAGPKPHKRGDVVGGNWGKLHPYKIEFIKTGELKLPFVLKAGPLLNYELGTNHGFGESSGPGSTSEIGRSRVFEHHVLMNDLRFE